MVIMSKHQAVDVASHFILWWSVLSGPLNLFLDINGQT